jgi:hypothetical protein
MSSRAAVRLRRRASLGGLVIVLGSFAAPAYATTRASAAAPGVTAKRIASHAQAAVAYAKRRGVTSTITVIDTRTGASYTAGRVHHTYPAASTAKIFTAVLILARHRLDLGRNRADMWAMVTRSDNAAWGRLNAQVGWGSAITAVEHRYRIHIGTEPHNHYYSGLSMVTAPGMARMYAAIKHDRLVWPWLRHAMTHIAAHGADGSYQLFGIPQAHPVGGYALKQGWLRTDVTGHAESVMHSTGYVDKRRYVVCIYTQAPAWMYAGVAFGRQGVTISGEAKRLMPHRTL